MPLPVQVVLQGGGAKLCHLMAVIASLREFSNAGDITISRVAGTSAGSIATAMLLSPKPIDFYIAEIKRLYALHSPQLRSNPYMGTWRVVNGRPYFADFHLENFFRDLFPSANQLITVGDLRRAHIYYTDLYSLGSRKASDDEPLPTALAKSCRFPFAFVGYRSEKMEVDGGLALNLPVDELKAQQAREGDVIGISFLEEHPDVGRRSLVGFTQQLFAAAVQSNVLRSKDIIGADNVFLITSNISTFDFSNALDAGLSTEFRRVKAEFDTWFRAWLSKKQVPLTPVHLPKPRLVRPSLSNAPVPTAIVRELDARAKSAKFTHARSLQIAQVAELDTEAKFTGKYFTKTTMAFQLTEETNVIQFDFQIGPRASFSEVGLGCSASDSRGRSLRFAAHVQEISNVGSPLRTFRLFFLFDEMLGPRSPDQPYMLDYELKADNPYPNLKNGADFFSFTRQQGDADSIALTVAFPRSEIQQEVKVGDISTCAPAELKRVGFVDEGEVLVPSQAMMLSEFQAFLELEHPVERYILVGRRATNVLQGQSFGFVIDC